MEINKSGMEGLRSLLGVSQPAPAAAQARNAPAAADGTLGGDQATLSSAASGVLQAAADDSVRADKVAGVQAALAAGAYHVPASAVASKLVDVMLAGDR